MAGTTSFLGVSFLPCDREAIAIVASGRQILMARKCDLADERNVAANHSLEERNEECIPSANAFRCVGNSLSPFWSFEKHV